MTLTARLERGTDVTIAEPVPAITPDRVRAPLPFRAALLVRIVTVISVAALGFVGYLLVISPVQHDRAQSLLRARLNDEFNAQTAPAGGAIDPGAPVAVLRVPRLRLNQVVVEGTAGRQLADGPGHRRTSPLPGQPGTSVIMGRALTYGGPFRDLPRLRPGDELTVATGQGSFTYRVDGVRRSGDPLPSPLQPDEGRLILITVEGGGTLGPDRTVFVDATLNSPAKTPVGARTRAQTADEAVLARDRTSIVGLVLWLQLLVLAAAAFTWCRLRWGRRETWVVGVPAVFAAGLQVCGHAAVALLPNLL